MRASCAKSLVDVHVSNSVLVLLAGLLCVGVMMSSSCVMNQGRVLDALVVT